MTPSGRCAHVVKPNGTLVHTSQYCVDGMTLIFTRMPASFHCSTIAWTASSSQPGCGRQTISVSMPLGWPASDRKSTRLNSSHLVISYAVFCLKKKKSTGLVHEQV